MAAAAAILGLLLLGASGARASSILSFQLTAGNTAIAGYAGAYATVTVDLTSPTMATITFTGSSVGGSTYLFGDSSAAAVNVNASSWTIGSFSSSNAGTGFSPGSLSDAGSGNVDSFGVFDQRVNDFDGFMHAADTVQFTITNTGGSWADASSVLTPNPAGNMAAAHIFVCSGSGTCSQAGGALVTGYAAQLPEPSALALLLVGGSWLAARRFRGRSS